MTDEQQEKLKQKLYRIVDATLDVRTFSSENEATAFLIAYLTQNLTITTAPKQRSK